MDSQNELVPAGRGPGRPSEPIIGPEELEQISDWIAQGWTMTKMAKELGVAVSTVSRTIDNRIIPIMREPRFRSLETLVTRLEWLYRKACECFAVDKKAETLKLGLQLQQELSVLLRYRSDKTINILQYTRSDEEFRMAGASPSQIDEEMLALVDRLIEEQDRYEAALNDRYVTLEQTDADTGGKT